MLAGLLAGSAADLAAAECFQLAPPSVVETSRFAICVLFVAQSFHSSFQLLFNLIFSGGNRCRRFLADPIHGEFSRVYLAWSRQQFYELQKPEGLQSVFSL